MRLRQLRSLSEPTELEKQKTLFGNQIINLIVTGFSFLFWWLIIERFWPAFFNPGQYWCITENVWVSVFKFYPLFIYCGALSIICSIWIKGSSADAESILFANIVTSTLAGIWEELGFRCIFILTGMIAIMFSNWCWEVMMSIFLIIGIILFFGGLIESEFHAFLGTIFIIFCGGALVFVYCYGIKDPVYWFYEKITFPVLNFISFGKLDFVLNNDLDFLFVAGAISANAKFRDGHKYQGFIGFLNSWFIGFVMLYALLNYGLIVAIIIHALYDIEIGLIRYCYRKVIAINGD